VDSHHPELRDAAAEVNALCESWRRLRLTGTMPRSPSNDTVGKVVLS
jgi:hypothetical protein